MHVSPKGIDLITEFEGFSAKAYKDPGSKDGLPITIGYGTTSLNGQSIKLGDTITKARARAALIDQLENDYEGAIVAIGVELNQNEFDALACLIYNIGVTSFRKSTVRRRLIAGDRVAAANAFGMWVKNDGKTMAGLVRRRAAEKALFLTPVEAPKTAPTAPTEDVGTPSTAVAPQSPEKPLFKSKEIIGGGGAIIGGITTAIQSVSVDDLLSAQNTVKATKAEVQANKTIIGHNYIIQGASLLFVLIGILIIYKRISARIAGHR